MDADVLSRFSPATRAWFESSFSAPTPAQAGAWEAIGSGRHTLVVAPTGSGKTLAAFLSAIDQLTSEPPPEDALRRCRVLYVSPLKALAVDVERNLRSPLIGIGHAAARLGLARPDVSVGVRSGDTPADERRKFARTPSDILITTPESLYLLLTSQAREALRGVQTVILDEVHAVAGTKRGAHLALSLERLDALLDRPAQRIGLSATVRPLDEVARFLAGGRPVTTVAPPADKRWDLSVVVPVPDLASLDAAPAPSGPTGNHGDPSPRVQPSIWPHVEERVADLVEQHRSTLVFTNSRRLAETLTTRLNEIAEERATGEDPRADTTGMAPRPHSTGYGTTSYSAGLAHPGLAGRPPDERSGSDSLDPSHAPGTWPAGASAEFAPLGAGAVRGAGIIARAHHGSVSHAQRAETEEALKQGLLPAVVATSSLELGIDMGAVDLVVQVEAPPSVASGLQRVGRAGHQVGAVSRGVFFPKFRGDLVASAVIVERMREGAIEALAIPSNPLDVLAQQIVAMVALDDWNVDDLETTIRRAAPFAGLTRGVLEAVLDMLSGRYPAEEFSELRPRLVWDRVAGTLTGRRGAQRVAVTSGGTIPDRGLFGVFIAGDGPGRRVGELDEEMVYESRVGDVITLGTSTWRIEDITHDQVLVSPAPGQPGRLPFWKGDTLGRPAELGEAVGAFVREIGGLDPDAARARLAEGGLDAWASDNLLAYLSDQRTSTGQLPTDRTIVVERFTDELGDWRVIVHSPYGAGVHAPWALAIAARMRERYGLDVQAMHSDDGIVLRLPDVGWSDGWDDGASSWDSASRPGGATSADAGASHYTRIARVELTGAGRATSADASAEGDPGGGPWAGTPPRDASRAGTGRARDPHADLLELILLDPDEVTPLVTEEVGGSALFASRFRECAGRALLLPNRRPGHRQALWQQRQRSAALLEVASKYPAFPIVLEAVRECMQDVFDVPGLVELLRRIRTREVSVAEVTTTQPSPFASSLMFGYVAQFLYEGDSPLAERRAAALALDPDLLAELLGTSEGLSLRDLLDAGAIARTEAELQHLVESRKARDADDLTDLLRALGPLSTAELALRSVDPEAVPDQVQTLVDARRIFAMGIHRETGLDTIEVPRETYRDGADQGAVGDIVASRRLSDLPPSVDGRREEREETATAGSNAEGRVQADPRTRWAAIEDAGRLRDALGVALPAGVPHAFAEPVADPFGDLLVRYARTHAPFGADAVAAWLGGLGQAIVLDGLRRLVADGRLVEGEFTPTASGREFCDPAVLRTIRRRSVAALRAEIEPVDADAYARFLPAWQGIGDGSPGGIGAGGGLAGGRLGSDDFRPVDAAAHGSRTNSGGTHGYVGATSDGGMSGGVPRGGGTRSSVGRWRGVDGVLRVAEQLAGVPLPASALEPLVLASRVRDYAPAMLDELTASGEVIWRGHGSLAGSDGWVSLWPAELVHLAPPPGEPESDAARALLAALQAGGAQFFPALVVAAGLAPTGEASAALWELVWHGLATNDTLAPLRARLGGGGTTHRARPAAARSRYGRPRLPRTPRLEVARDAGGRWSLLPEASADPTEWALTTAEVLLDRYGVVTRGAVQAEEIPGGFAGVYRVLSAAEDAGRVRRGYFVEGLGAAQFGTVGAVDRLRSGATQETIRDGRHDGSVTAPADSRNDPTSYRGGFSGDPIGRTGSRPAQAVVLAACDPANPFGAALPWPASGDHRPARKAGALVVLVGGRLIAWIERGGRTALSWPNPDQPDAFDVAAAALAGLVQSGRLAALTVEKIDGEPALTGDHPFAASLLSAGFRHVPKGLRLRR